MPTPQTWPDGTVPSPEQATSWLLTCESDEQIVVVGNLMHNASLAAACVQEGHPEQIAQLRGGLAETYIKIAQIRQLHIANGMRQCIACSVSWPCKTAKVVYNKLELGQ